MEGIQNKAIPFYPYSYELSIVIQKLTQTLLMCKEES